MHELEERISLVVESIWSRIVGFAPEGRAGATWTHSGTKDFGASIGIRGEWNGEVSVVCSDSMARRAAEQLLAVEPDGACLDDLDEAVREITGLVAESLKPLIDANGRLGSPALFEPLVQGSGHAGAEIVAEVCFERAGESMVVLVTRR
jgi:CheY-specific phosphatase CheX